jgi:hypothetical protein
MSIRPLERRDVDAAAWLHARAAGPGADQARAARFRDFFERTLLDSPWSDPEIPSLVYEEDGEVLGFLASYVRHMVFDGNPVRIACSANLLTDPRVRTRAAGALLSRQYMAGPQDLTITDGANDTARRMWEALGAQMVHVSCLAFVRVLRPFGLAADRLTSRLNDDTAARAVAPVARVLDAAIARRRGSASRTATERLTPEGLVENLPAVADGLRLVPAYDVNYLRWLFGELDRVGAEGVFPQRVRRGPLFAELVRDGDHVSGWYVTQLRRGGLCRVLQLAARPQSFGLVLDELDRRARALGAVGVFGRLEPHLVSPLTQRKALLRFGRGRMLVHGNRDIADAILRGDALLTRLDGEWW